jgi:hypothetical protein
MQLTFLCGVVWSGVQNHKADLLPPPPPVCPHKLSLTVLTLLLQERQAMFASQAHSAALGDADPRSPWLSTTAARLNFGGDRLIKLLTVPSGAEGEEPKQLQVRVSSTGADPTNAQAQPTYSFRIDDWDYAVTGRLSPCGTVLTAIVGDRAYRATGMCVVSVCDVNM